MSTTEEVRAWATVGAVVVSVVAAVIAARSAGASERSARTAERALHRSSIRELIGACHEAAGEEHRIHSLAVDLLPEYTAAAVFAGQSGGSREAVLKGEVEKAQSAAREAALEARTLADEPSRLVDASDHDLNQMHARVEKSRVALRGIREKLERDLGNVRSQNAESRKGRG